MGELCPHGWQAQITLYGYRRTDLALEQIEQAAYEDDDLLWPA